MSGLVSVQSQNAQYPELNEYILEQMDLHHTPGLSACMIVGDSIVWNSNYGFMDLEDSIPVHDSTLFQVYSIGKSITTSCVMRLWDQGIVGLDQNINDYMPFQVINPHNGAGNISARMLISHTSSINDWNFYPFVVIGDPTIPLGSFMVDYLTSSGTFFHMDNYYDEQPGTQHHYDNYGSSLTGYLVEPLTGLEFHDYAQDSLLDPLEMYCSSWFLGDLIMENLARGYEYSYGSFLPKEHRGHPAYPSMALRSSALELSNFAIMLLNHGVYKGQSILSGDAVDSMTTVQNPSWAASIGPTGLGLYKREDFGNRIVWGHNGGSVGGYAAQLYFCDDDNTAVVVTTNSEQYVDSIMTKLFDFVAMIIIPEEATDIHENGFTALWNSAPAANEYFFSLFEVGVPPVPVPGYEELAVGSDTSLVVDGLEPETEYFFKIRGHDGSGYGPYSGIISLTTLEGPTGASDEMPDEVSFEVFPNPASSILRIRYNDDQGINTNICICNMNGMQVFSRSFNNSQTEIDISNLPAGIYIVKVWNDKEVMLKKVIKK